MITCMLWVLLTLLNCSMYRASSVKGATWRSPLKNIDCKSLKVLLSHVPAGEHSAPGFQELLSVQERLQHPLVEQHVAHRLGYDYIHLDKKWGRFSYLDQDCTCSGTEISSIFPLMTCVTNVIITEREFLLAEGRVSLQIFPTVSLA